jgi:hypothetical protein
MLAVPASGDGPSVRLQGIGSLMIERCAKSQVRSGAQDLHTTSVRGPLMPQTATLAFAGCRRDDLKVAASALAGKAESRDPTEMMKTRLSAKVRNGSKCNLGRTN